MAVLMVVPPLVWHCRLSEVLSCSPPLSMTGFCLVRSSRGLTLPVLLLQCLRFQSPSLQALQELMGRTSPTPAWDENSCTLTNRGSHANQQQLSLFIGI